MFRNVIVMKFKFTIYVSLLTLVIVSCSERSQIRKVLHDFQETEIILPEDLEIYHNKIFKWADLSDMEALKLIIYYDSTECATCRVFHLKELDSLYRYAESDGRFSVMTIFSPDNKDIETIRLNLLDQNITFPVYIDLNKSFAKLNTSIPNDIKFHCFLINERGIPLFVGNPIANEHLKEVFDKLLSNIV